MTTTVTTAQTGPLTANGVTPLPFTFQSISATEIGVTRNGVVQVGGYTVTRSTTGTGSVVPTSSWGSDSVIIYSAPNYAQPTAFSKFGAFYPDQVNPALDRLARGLITLKALIARAGFPFGIAVANKYPKFGADGTLTLSEGTPGVAGTNGINGGIGSSAGFAALFGAASGMTVATGITVIRTSGYSTDGVGGADYIYDAAVNAAFVTAHPRASFIAADGRGFRLDTSLGISLPQVGGFADSTTQASGLWNGTDNAPAVAAAIAISALRGRGAVIHFPQGAGMYRFASRVVLTSSVILIGDGWSYNPELVAGVSYPAPSNNSGTILCFDQGVGGFKFLPFTDNAANAIAYEYQSSLNSQVEDMMLYGGGGTGTTAHGIEAFASIHCRNLYITNFAGTGLRNEANSAGTGQWGSADGSTFHFVVCRANKLHGFHTLGDDANVQNYIGCDGSLNGGAGFLEGGFLGNTHTGPHAAINNSSHPSGYNPTGHSAAQRAQVVADCTVNGTSVLADEYAGSYITNSAVGGHVFTGAYAEIGLGYKAHLVQPTIVVGGFLSSSANFTALSTAQIIEAGGALVNYNSVKPSGPFTVKGSILSVTSPDANASTLDLTGPSSFSTIKMRSGGVVENGCTIGVYPGGVTLDAGAIGFRNAAQTVTFGTFTSAGLNLTSGAYKVAGTQVVGAQQVKPATPTLADVIAVLSTHGLWA